MINISKYINEGLTKVQQNIIGELILKMFENTKLSNEQLQNIFNNIDLNYLKDIGHYIMKIDNIKGMPYVPTDDEYLVKENKEKIIKMLSEYFYKYVVNK